MPDPTAQPDYHTALAEIGRRIAASLAGTPPQALPIRMVIAGGTALHWHTGDRISKDVDAAFSRRIALPDDLDIAYLDADGSSALLYLDRNYNDTFALLHEDAYNDALPLSLPGVDPHVLDIRLLTPLDLAVSKLARFGQQDREDIASLGRHGLIAELPLRQRAEQAMGGYIGDLARLRSSLDIACRMLTTR